MTELGQASGIPMDELEKFKDIPILAASDIADAVIYVLGTPPHVQVSIKCKAIPVTEPRGP
jgi:NADP-dependent 3-hydroxy acid dehydrogenase YdfG